MRLGVVLVKWASPFGWRFRCQNDSETLLSLNKISIWFGAMRFRVSFVLPPFLMALGWDNKSSTTYSQKQII